MMELDLNQSQFIQEAIEDKFISLADPKTIDFKINQYQQKIQELKELKKTKNIHQETINEILNYHAPRYKIQAQSRTEKQRLDYINRSILKDLKRAGFEGSAHDVDELLLKDE